MSRIVYILLNEIKNIVKLKEKIEFASPNYFLYYKFIHLVCFNAHLHRSVGCFPSRETIRKKVVLQDGNPMEICYKLVVSM